MFREKYSQEIIDFIIEVCKIVSEYEFWGPFNTIMHKITLIPLPSNVFLGINNSYKDRTNLNTSDIEESYKFFYKFVS